jgi:hypothetical protein
MVRGRTDEIIYLRTDRTSSLLRTLAYEPTDVTTLEIEASFMLARHVSHLVLLAEPQKKEFRSWSVCLCHFPRPLEALLRAPTNDHKQ